MRGHPDQNRDPYNLRSNGHRFAPRTTGPRHRGENPHRGRPPPNRTQLFRVPPTNGGVPFPYRQESFSLSSSYFPQGNPPPTGNRSPHFSTPSSTAPQDLQGFTGIESLYSWDNNSQGFQADWKLLSETPKSIRDEQTQIELTTNNNITPNHTKSIGSFQNSPVAVTSSHSVPNTPIAPRPPTISSNNTDPQFNQTSLPSYPSSDQFNVNSGAQNNDSPLYSPPSFHATSQFAQELISQTPAFNNTALGAVGGEIPIHTEPSTSLPNPPIPTHRSLMVSDMFPYLSNLDYKAGSVVEMFNDLPEEVKPHFENLIKDYLKTNNVSNNPARSESDNPNLSQPNSEIVTCTSNDISVNVVSSSPGIVTSNYSTNLLGSSDFVGVKPKLPQPKINPFISSPQGNVTSQVSYANDNFSYQPYQPGFTPTSVSISKFPYNSSLPQFLKRDNFQGPSHPLTCTNDNIIYPRHTYSVSHNPPNPVPSMDYNIIVTTGVTSSSTSTNSTVTSNLSNVSSTISNTGLTMTDLLPTIVEQVQVAVQAAFRNNSIGVSNHQSNTERSNTASIRTDIMPNFSTTSGNNRCSSSLGGPTNVTFTNANPIPSASESRPIYSQGGEIDLEMLANLISSRLQPNRPETVSRSSDCDSSSSNTSRRSDISNRSFRHRKKDRDSKHQNSGYKHPNAFDRTHSGQDRTHSEHLSRTTVHLSEADKTVLIQHGVTEEALRDRDENAESSMNLVDLPSLPRSQFVVNLSSSDIEQFSGNLEDYDEFKASFLAYAQSIPMEQRLMLLKMKLSGQAKNLVSECFGVGLSSFNKAFEILDKRYHKPELLIQKLLAQIEESLDRSCKHSDAKFSNMISNVRRCYQRIFLIDPRKVWTLDGLLAKFSNCMPRTCLNNVTRMIKNNLSDHTFSKVLQVCEDYVEFKELQNITTGISTVSFNSPSGLSKSPSRSRDSSFRSRSHEKSNSVHVVSENSGSFTDESSVEGTVAAASFKQPMSSQGTNKEKVKRDISRGRSSSRSSNRSRSNSIVRPRSPYVETFTCNLCRKNDHVVTKCNGEFDNLEDIVYQRRLCLLCVGTGHFSSNCPILLLCPDFPMRCLNTECKDVPHCKKLCKIMKKQS